METNPPRTLASAFLAGALGVLIFHQGFLLLAYGLGWVSRPPYDLSATHPFDVPKVISLSFWGGLWGMAMIWSLRRLAPGHRLWAAFLFGGILPTFVGLLVVAPLHGQPIARPEPSRLLFGFVINGIWGLGTKLAYRILARRTAESRIEST